MMAPRGKKKCSITPGDASEFTRNKQQKKRGGGNLGYSTDFFFHPKKKNLINASIEKKNGAEKKNL